MKDYFSEIWELLKTDRQVQGAAVVLVILFALLAAREVGG